MGNAVVRLGDVRGVPVTREGVDGYGGEEGSVGDVVRGEGSEGRSGGQGGSEDSGLVRQAGSPLSSSSAGGTCVGRTVQTSSCTCIEMRVEDEQCCTLSSPVGCCVLLLLLRHGVWPMMGGRWCARLDRFGRTRATL